MRVLALSIAILALSALSAEAQPPSCNGTYVHYSAPGRVDNGSTIELSKGGFQTTYADGWSHASEPDATFGKGGRRMTDKDNTGLVRAITKCDPKGVARQAVEAEYQNGVIARTTTSWNAAGVQTSKDTTRTAAATPEQQGPPGQQAQPTQPPAGYTGSGGPPPGYPSAGGPPPGSPPGDQTMNGPPPGYDQGSNGPPPPGYDQGGPPPTGPAIGVGGVGFGFGFGFGHKP